MVSSFKNRAANTVSRQGFRSVLDRACGGCRMVQFSWQVMRTSSHWEFDDRGFMKRRIASINDLPIAAADRKYQWSLGRRPDDHPGFLDLGL